MPRNAISVSPETTAPQPRAPLTEIELPLPPQPAETTLALWPKITLVTAVYNGEKYLEPTIRSVLNQSYPNLEYIVVDDGSTDRTPQILRKYEREIHCSLRQSNQGLYAALNTGFAHSTGEVMGWLNSSDLLQVNGLLTVGSIFSKLTQVEWITGRPTKISDTGMTVDVLPIPRWSRARFLAGANKYIQQESTFWRRSLWQRAGGRLSTEFRAEGDFELWVRFFRHAQLYSVNALVGGYRLHDGALSSSNMKRYDDNCGKVAAREVQLLTPGSRAGVSAFRWTTQAVSRIPKVRGLWYRLAIKSLYNLPGPDWPPVIHYGDHGWELRP